jgi:hypothetical protein
MILKFRMALRSEERSRSDHSSGGIGDLEIPDEE